MTTFEQALDIALTAWMRDIIHATPQSDEAALAQVNALLASRAERIFKARFAIARPV